MQNSDYFIEDTAKTSLSQENDYPEYEGPQAFKPFLNAFRPTARKPFKINSIHFEDHMNLPEPHFSISS